MWIQLWNSAVIEHLWRDDVLMFQSHLQSIFVNKEVVEKWQWYKLFWYLFLSSLNIWVLLTSISHNAKMLKSIWMQASRSILVFRKERSKVKQRRHACVLKICHVRVHNMTSVEKLGVLPSLWAIFPFFACSVWHSKTLNWQSNRKIIPW